jgi:hypothetical protein
MTQAASFASGGMVTKITSSSAVGGVLSGLPRYFLMRPPQDDQRVFGLRLEAV